MVVGVVMVVVVMTADVVLDIVVVMVVVVVTVFLDEHQKESERCQSYPAGYLTRAAELVFSRPIQ